MTSKQKEKSFTADEMKIKITLSIRNLDLVAMISVRLRQMSGKQVAILTERVGSKEKKKTTESDSAILISDFNTSR